MTITIQENLSNLATIHERVMLIAVRGWLYTAHHQIRRDLTSKFQKDVVTELTDWDLIEYEGIRTIKPATLKIMQLGGNQVYRHLALTGSFDVLNVRAVGAAEKLVAKLVTDVTAGTKEGIRTYISAGIKEGKSMPKIARELRPLVGLTKNQTESIMNYRKLLEDTEKFPYLTQTTINRKVQRYADKTHRRRITSIARTETARAQNIGYCNGLEEVGVVEAEFSASPDACERCLAYNGERFPIKEAAWIIPVHPHGKCAMLPVVAGGTISKSLKKPPAGLTVAKAASKIEPIYPPEEAIVLKQYPAEGLSETLAMQISQGLRKTYPKKLNTRNFGEMENAILAYDSFRTLALVDKQIVGAISFQWDEVDELVYISHIGTLAAPKGTGAELVRTAVDAAYKGRWGMSLESTYEAIDFWKRLGFMQNKKVLYVFEADFKRVSQIKEALGVTGRIKEEAK